MDKKCTSVKNAEVHYYNIGTLRVINQKLLLSML